ncbi:agmatinase [Acidisphaera sp. L21]|uniref:agmatinase n=1 Tax=Acidisphaera sp. L21 TaxID=1641851 RepID=UPI0020B14560|nr:agmatinase [Acidisphaera sp. L21]
MEPIKQTTRYHEMADPQVQPRFSGIPTFFRAPYEQDLTQVDIGVIGVPFDGGVTNRPGTRHGPREIRNQSSLSRRINTATGVQPFDGLRVRDLGDAWIEQPYNLEPALGEIEAFYRKVVSAGVVPLSAGGDHSMTLPILRAVGANGPVGMVHIDAHADTGDEYMGSRYHHGTPFRRAVDEGLLDPKRVIQIGIRGHSNVAGGLWSFSESSGMRVMPIEELADRGWRWAVEEARRVVGDGATYLSFDIDSLDPIYAPGTGTPEPGGITMLEALRMVRGLTGLNFVGGDVVEVSPPFDVGGITAMHGAAMLFEILCVLAAARKQRAKK